MEFSWSFEEETEYIDLFQALIRLDTSNPPGNEEIAVRYLKGKLEEEEIDCQILETAPGRWNLMARIPGEKQTKKPIVFLSHLDVVAAKGEWSFPPFGAKMDGSMIYGRGTLDTKQLTAMQAMTMILVKRRKIVLNRDLVLIASADEENGSHFGMDFIKKNAPEWIQEGIVISEGGGFIVQNKDRFYRLITAGEKGLARIRLLAEGQGGHASCPPDEQSIVVLNRAVERLCGYSFKESLCSVSEQFLQILDDEIEDETLGNLWEYMTRSGFVFREFAIGGALNVLPAEAAMELEYRFIPGESQEDVEGLLHNLLEDLPVLAQVVDFQEGYISCVNSKAIRALEEASMKFGEDAKLLPILALGRTDGRFMKGDIYGFSPVLSDLPFSTVLKKVHGIDECISRDSLIFGLKVIFEAATELGE